MRKCAGKSSISALAAMMVFTLFAACVLSVLLAGAGVYRRLVDGGEEHYARRTMTQYIAVCVQQSETGRSIRVEPFGDGDALVIAQDIDAETYLKRIYCYDGWLMELFTAEQGEFAPEDGEKLLPAGGLSCELEGAFLQVTATDTDGTERELKFALRGGEEAGL